MSEKEARALGAGTTITVGKKEYTLRPIEVRHLCDLEREALKHYKRQYLETFAENADLLGGNGRDLLAEEMRAAASWSLDDCPKKTAFDVSRVPVTKELKKWAGEFQANVDGEAEKLTDDKTRALLSTALDREEIGIKQVERLSGKRPRQGKVRYDQWWVTGSIEGMVAFLFTSIRYEHKELTKEEVRSWPVSSIFEGARKVEEITAPSMGNG